MNVLLSCGEILGGFLTVGGVGWAAQAAGRNFRNPAAIFARELRRHYGVAFTREQARKLLHEGSSYAVNGNHYAVRRDGGEMGNLLLITAEGNLADVPAIAHQSAPKLSTQLTNKELRRRLVQAYGLNFTEAEIQQLRERHTRYADGMELSSDGMDVLSRANGKSEEKYRVSFNNYPSHGRGPFTLMQQTATAKDGQGTMYVNVDSLYARPLPPTIIQQQSITKVKQQNIFVFNDPAAKQRKREAKARQELTTLALNLDQELRRLDTQVNTDRQLPEFFKGIYNQIVTELHEVLPEMHGGHLGTEDRYTLEAIVRDYLPTLYTNTHALPQSYLGRKDHAVVMDLKRQLVLILNTVKGIQDKRFEAAASSIAAQGEFLAEKYDVSRQFGLRGQA